MSRTDYPAPIHLPDDRRLSVSRWSSGNTKLWPSGTPGCYSYSRLAGHGYTCPGATAYCELICYAIRAQTSNADLRDAWIANSFVHTLPRLPADARLVRIHVSGDFDTPDYVRSWLMLVDQHPNVRFFGYTRSWTIPELVPLLARLRDRPNVQLFASVDPEHSDGRSRDLPGEKWRIAWFDTDPRIRGDGDNRIGVRSYKEHSVVYVCPEETGRKKDCLSCGYCFRGQRGDVVFIERD